MWSAYVSGDTNLRRVFEVEAGTCPTGAALQLTGTVLENASRERIVTGAVIAKALRRKLSDALLSASAVRNSAVDNIGEQRD
jgi:hypothetical protein